MPRSSEEPKWIGCFYESVKCHNYDPELTTIGLTPKLPKLNITTVLVRIQCFATQPFVACVQWPPLCTLQKINFSWRVEGGGGGCEQAIIWMIQFMSEGSSHVVPNSYALQG